MSELEIRANGLPASRELGPAADPNALEWGDGGSERPFRLLSEVPPRLIDRLFDEQAFPGELVTFAVDEPVVANSGKRAGLRRMDAWLAGDDRVSLLTFRESQRGEWEVEAKVHRFGSAGRMLSRTFEAGEVARGQAPDEAVNAGGVFAGLDLGDANILPEPVRQKLAALSPFKRYQAHMWRWGGAFPTTSRRDFGYEVYALAFGHNQVISIEATRFAQIPSGMPESAAIALYEMAPWKIKLVHGQLA